jgi:outer membrane protein assembly factor BamB
MKRTIFPCILLGVFFLICSPSQYAQNIAWPQFRGINCSGIADENQDPPISFGKDQNMIWNTNLSKGQSSPCIWQDIIFITGVEEEEKLLKMYCIDRLNGTINWLKQISVDEFEKAHAVSSPANATPATDGERAVFYFSSYGLLCYDLNGEKHWEMTMPIPKSRHGMGTSPVISGDLVIMNCFGHVNDPCLLAINKYNGETIWKYSWPIEEGEWADSYSTPVIYKDQIIIYRSADVSAYDLKTGDQVWRFLTGLGDAVCTPVIGNDIVYVTVFSTFGNAPARAQFPDFEGLVSEHDENRDRLISKEELVGFEFVLYPEKGVEVSSVITAADYFGWYDHNKDSFIDSTEWAAMIEFCESDYLKQGIKAFRFGREGDISFSNFIWGESANVPHVTSPLCYNNHVYMVKSGGIVSCFRAEEGELLYSERIGAAGAYFASPVAVNGKIFFTSRTGVITVVEAGDQIKILARNDLDEVIAATPAIIGNKFRTPDLAQESMSHYL